MNASSDFDFILRDADPSDDQQIGELLVHSFVETYRRKMPEVVVTDARKEYLRDVASKRGQGAVLVAAQGPKVIATVGLARAGTVGSRLWNQGLVELRGLAVDERFRGNGVSKALMDFAEQRARQWKVSGIGLHVRQGATGVALFYLRHGYRRTPEGDLDLRPEIYLEAYQKDLN